MTHILKINEWMQVNAPKYTTTTTQGGFSNVKKEDTFGKEKIVATKETIYKIVRDAIQKLGNDADLNFIDTSGVTEMNEIFYGTDFNGDISQWNTSNVTDMRYMFYHSKFNGDISKWDTSKVKNMESMFCKSSFNGDISEWDTSNVENMEKMFSESKFDKDISKWNVSKVKNFSFMFEVSKFNGDISKWDVRNGKGFQAMFQGSVFNGDLSKWQPNREHAWMRWMFEDSQFNGDISNWDIVYVKTNKYESDNDTTVKTLNMFKNSPLDENPPKWYKRHYDFDLYETDNIPQECIDYIVATVNDFNDRYQKDLDFIDGLGTPFKKADPELFDEILKAANDWLEKEKAGYKARPSDIVKTFDPNEID